MNKQVRIKRRPVDGVLLFDKPIGYSSNQALQRVKYLFRAEKAGHTGSLDPLATGLLPLCFGQATKVSGMLLDADKTYVATGRLGVRTTTGDAEGEIFNQASSEAISAVTAEYLQQAMSSFEGDIMQVPPMYSALKHDGKRLYDLARRGVVVQREPRAVRIHKLKLVDFSLPDFTIEVSCSKGTYIRTLIEEIGQAVGCGAHVIALRRTAIAGFADGRMVGMDEIEKLVAAEANPDSPTGLDRLLEPIDVALGHLPVVELSRDSAFYLQRGQPVQAHNPDAVGKVRIYQESPRQLIGIGEMLDDGRVAPKRLFSGRSQ